MNAVAAEAQAMAAMPQYQSHKKVWALKIRKVHTDDDGQGIGITFTDPAYAIRAFTADQLKGKPTPSPGWYMVQYEDGYLSFSPEKAFEEGYTPVGARTRTSQPLQPHQERVVQEKAELTDKVDRLETFLNGKVYSSLSAAEQSRLTRQLLIMKLYEQVLSERVSAF